MSTTPVETWAVDLKTVSLIYPGVGWEWLLVLASVALWLVWQVWPCRHESDSYRREIRQHAVPQSDERSAEQD